MDGYSGVTGAKTEAELGNSFGIVRSGDNGGSE